MSTRFNTFFNALVDICEAYSEAKEKADAKKAEMELLEDIFGGTATDRSEVVATMIECGWRSYEMDEVLPLIDTPEKAKVAVHMIKSGNYRYYDISKILKRF